MAAPWEQYQQANVPPWVLYGGSATPPAAAPAPVPLPASRIAPAAPGMGSGVNTMANPTSDPTGVERALTLGVQDAGRGAANFAGLPVDLLNTIINMGLTGADAGSSALGGPQIPFRLPVDAGQTISNAVGGAADAFGFPGIPDVNRTPGETTTGNVVDLATQFGLGGMAAARRVPQLLERIIAGQTPADTPMATRVADTFTRPYLNNPGAALTVETGAGAGAGAGKDAVDQYVPADSPWKPLATAGAELVGGLGGSGITRLGESAVTGLANLPRRMLADPNVPRDMRSGKTFTGGQSDTVASVFQNAASDGGRNPGAVGAARDTLAANAADLKAANIPASATPTSGLLSGNTNLISAERGFRTRDSAPFIARDQGVKNEASSRVASLQDPNADQSAVKSAAMVQRDLRLMPAETDLTNAEVNANRTAAARTAEGAPVIPFRSATRGAEASRNLDTAVVDQTYVPARAEKNALYNAVDPNRTEMVDAQPVIDAAQRVRDNVNALGPQAQQLPAEFVNRIEALAPQAATDEAGNVTNVGGTGQVAVGDLVDLRKYISTARQSARASGNFELADNLGVLQDSVNAATEGSPAAAAANANYANTFAPTFRPGPGDEAAKFTKAIDRAPDRTTTPPEKTAGRFLAAPEKAQALQRILDTSPAAAQGQAAVRDYLMHDFASSALNPDGTINAVSAHAWLDGNDSVLASFPAARTEFANIVNGARDSTGRAATATEELRTAQRAAQSDQAAVDRSQVGTLLKEDPRDVASSLLSGGYGASAKLDEITSVIANNPAAQRGWKAAVAEVLADRVTSATKNSDNFEASLAKMSAEFKNNTELLTKVFTPDEMKTLQEGHNLLSFFKQGDRNATSGSNTVEKTVNGESALMAGFNRAAEIALKIRYGVLKGGGHMRVMRLVGNSLPAGENGVAELARMAWFDPELMTYLLGKKVKNNTVSGNPALRAAIITADTGRAAYGDPVNQDPALTPKAK